VRRGLTAEIDLDAARHNFRAITRTAAGRPVIAVVKADAYGHGAVELSKVFAQTGASALAVAFVSEARKLRNAGITLPILVFFDRTEVPAYFDLSLTPVLHDMKTAQTFSAEASRRGTALDVHLKVDTGMGRMGSLEVDELLQIAALPSLNAVGLMSHFSEADMADASYMNLQLERFGLARDVFRKKGFDPMCHMANSAATLSRTEAHMDAVRPGLILYGISPFEDLRPGLPQMKPTMRVTTNVLTVRSIPKGHPISYGRTFVPQRQTRSALIPAGYADGFNRLFSNNAEVLVRGRRAPVVGRVCMDLTAVDVTDIDGVTEGEEVTLLGRDGAEHISAWELARRASTIPYETLCIFGGMGNRRYVGAAVE
jgi:alanine racemase